MCRVKSYGIKTKGNQSASKHSDSCAAISHAFDQSIALFLARNLNAKLIGLLHVERALCDSIEILWDFRTDNIPSYKEKGRDKARTRKRRRRSRIRCISSSSESVETKPAIISASIIREAPVSRAKASTSHSKTYTRGIAKRVTVPRTRNTLFI